MGRMDGEVNTEFLRVMRLEQIGRLRAAAQELADTDWNRRKAYSDAESWYRTCKESLESIEDTLKRHGIKL